MIWIWEKLIILFPIIYYVISDKVASKWQNILRLLKKNSILLIYESNYFMNS
jgi:hypothetical protein